MRRSSRLFDLIQHLRAAKAPVRAEDLAHLLEVSTRTIYRDIAALQAMRTPIEGEPGIGYVMRRGYDLPPLNFDEEELEALRVGLALLVRTGDRALQSAAERIFEKIEALGEEADWLQVAPWGAPLDQAAVMARCRQAIREERKIRIFYRDVMDQETERVLRPLALVYHLEATLLAAWCELRSGFRHFRMDRIITSEALEIRFEGQSTMLRDLWLEGEGAQWRAPSATS
jgi:predicted DNA-binding transcriptional regulator YafY